MKLLSKTLLTAVSISALLVGTVASASPPTERGMHKLSDSERQIQRDQWFAQVDTNNDGYISEEEFVAMATARAAERAKAAFARMDQQNTGEISAEDFAQLAEQRMEQAAERRQTIRERGQALRHSEGEGKRHWRSRSEGNPTHEKGERRSEEQRKEQREQRRSERQQG